MEHSIMLISAKESCWNSIVFATKASSPFVDNFFLIQFFFWKTKKNVYLFAGAVEIFFFCSLWPKHIFHADRQSIDASNWLPQMRSFIVAHTPHTTALRVRVRDTLMKANDKCSYINGNNKQWKPSVKLKATKYQN